MTAALTLEPAKTALVIVDLQEKLLPVISTGPQVVRNALLLLRLAESLGIPAVLTTQYSKGLGPTVPEVLAQAPGHPPIDKTTFGCFGSEAFRNHVSGLGGRTQLLIAGVETHICVTQTVLGAIEHGFSAHVASDAVGSRTPENHRIGLSRMERAGAALSSTEMAVYELLGRSDTPAFKAMLPHLR
jgi:nicotinamidase-related amidase